MLMSYSSQIKKLITFLESGTGSIEELVAVPQFHDDPKFFLYSSYIFMDKNTTDGILNPIYGSGISFSDPKVALIKCLGESIERVCLSTYKKEDLKYRSFDDLSGELFPISSYSPNLSVESRVGCIGGKNITKDKACSVPADLVYLNYRKSTSEAVFRFPKVSTGSAGSFNDKEAILRGIYEVIERDAFMNIYLGMIPAQMIDHVSINNIETRNIISQCRGYNFEIYLFNITTDLEIPSFLSILIDRTGVGPAVSVGAKVGFKTEDAIQGSMQEAFMVRNMLRNFTVRKEKDTDAFTGHILERGLRWNKVSSIKKLDFLLNQKPQKVKLENPQINTEKEYKKTIDILKKKGYDVYCVEISVKELKKLGYAVYKVLIPGLYPLYLYEEERKFLNYSRLRTVCKWFGRPARQNPVPHPFL